MKKIIMLMSFLMGACFIAPIHTAQEMEIEQFDGDHEDNIEQVRRNVLRYVRRLQSKASEIPNFPYKWELDEYVRRLRDREFDGLEEIQNARQWTKGVFDRGVEELGLVMIDQEEE